MILTLTEIYHLIVLGLFLFFWGNFILNLLVFRRPAKVKGELQVDGKVSVLIPARNEESRLGDCLESILAQDDFPMEVIVLNDRSEDGTAALVESFIAKDSRLKMIQGTSLPEGWMGKSWACAQLAKEAEGKTLIFTDADTRHHAGSIKAALNHANVHRADMLSLWPEQETQTFGEKLIIPLIHLLLLLFLPHWMPGRNRALGSACGQFVLFRREAYDQLGGHEKVRSHLVEDVALGRETRQAGLRLVNGDGCRWVTCRMYTSFDEIWEGFTKNLRAGFEGSVATFIVLGGLQLTMLLLPFFFLAGYLTGILSCTELEWRITLSMILLIFAFRIALKILYWQSWTGVLFNPVGQFIALCIAMNSWVKTSSGVVRWKGRAYKVQADEGTSYAVDDPTQDEYS